MGRSCEAELEISMARHVNVSLIGAAMLDMKGHATERTAKLMNEHLEAELNQVFPDHPDLILLPEFCDMTGSETIAQYRDFCAARGDQVLEYIASKAKQHQVWITYPALRRTAQRTWRNSIQLINRQGEIAGIYDKNHLTIPELEAGIEPGCDVPIVQTDFGRVAMTICFDLNFEELRSRVARQSPDLILFCSMFHGGLMQEYWAHSCRAHFASAVCNLPSRIISPVGQTLATTTNYVDWVTTSINLDCRLVHLDHHAEKLRDLKKKYGRAVRVLDPGLLAAVLVSSESSTVTVDQMLSEFEIERLDDYLNRCRQHRPICS